MQSDGRQWHHKSSHFSPIKKLTLILWTLSSPYYDMLVGNAFLEFGDLLYAVGRIEYGIKKGRIANTEARVPEQRRNVVDEHIRATSCRKETRENSMRKKKLLKTFIIHHKSCFLHPNYQFKGRDPYVNSNYS